MIQVTEHKGIAGNEIPNLLAKEGSQTPFIGPKPASSSPGGAVRD
jgi:hypothetical protein